METVTTTEKTEVTIESTPDSVHEERTVEVTTEVPRPPEPAFEPDLGHHCTCPECLEWEEDVAHEIATLRERANSLEERIILLTEMKEYHPLDRDGNPRPAVDGAGGDASPPPVAEAPAEGETVVTANPEIEERREKPSKFGGGWIF